MYAKEGTEIRAVESGTIFLTSKDQKISGMGNYVVLKFSVEKNGKKVVRYALYAHLKNIDVKKGDKVSEGQKLGSTGTSGVPKNQPKNGSHLHFEIIKKWWPGTGEKGNQNREDPASYMNINDASKKNQGETSKNSGENNREDKKIRRS